MPDQPRIGITLGDVTGIGPEIVDKALRSRKLRRGIRYEVIGDPHTRRPADAINWLVDGATRCARGSLAALVTAPISKKLINQAGYPFVGQTELLAHISHTKKFAMLLAGGPLRVALVTTHLPLRDVAHAITTQKIIEVVQLTDAFCRRLGIRRPRIGVAGLNPHGGEDGLFGGEERTRIAPAVQAARRKRLDVTGPVPADTLFHRAYHGEFDAVVAMYHDQGLAPLKMIAFDSGVNTTLGLPFIRTSPDHGTAPDIAGQGIARPDSLIAAINLAADLVKGKRARRSTAAPRRRRS